MNQPGDLSSYRRLGQEIQLQAAVAIPEPILLGHQPTGTSLHNPEFPAAYFGVSACCCGYCNRAIARQRCRSRAVAAGVCWNIIERVRFAHSLVDLDGYMSREAALIEAA